jgi:tetratricopeptide (TPR) repeat protein
MDAEGSSPASADNIHEHVANPPQSFVESPAHDKSWHLSRYAGRVFERAKVLTLALVTIFVLALVTFNLVSENRKDEVTDLCDKARNYCLSGRCEEAIALLIEGISKSPNAVQLYNELGISYEKIGKYDESLEVLRKAIHLDGKNAQAHYYMGINHIRQGARDACKVQYEILKSLDSEKADKLYGTLYE